MKTNNLPESWCVLNDGSEETYNILAPYFKSVHDVIITGTSKFYGVSKDGKWFGSNIDRPEPILTLSEFERMSKTMESETYNAANIIRQQQDDQLLNEARKDAQLLNPEPVKSETVDVIKIIGEVFDNTIEAEGWSDNGTPMASILGKSDFLAILRDKLSTPIPEPEK